MFGSVSDVRALNAAILIQDHFQLPYIRDILDSFAGNSIFGELDLSEAYLQFPLSVDSRPYTAFTWGKVQYMFIGAPFGLSQLPSHFQRVMNMMFRDLSFVLPFLDNLPFGSRTWTEHTEHLLALVARCNEYNLKLKHSALKVGQSNMRCLGHRLSAAGVSMDQSKLQVLLDWPLPVTGQQLQSFLGLVTFVRQYIRHIGEITAPLEAIKHHKVIEWTTELRDSFEVLKQALASAPFLRYPDFDRPLYVATDASNAGVGGVLYQPAGEGDDITPNNIIAICSKKLNDSQRRYSVYKKELYALVYALRQFHCYLWGRVDVVVFTDHKPLTHMFASRELSVPLQQWFDVILDYCFEIKYRVGVLNVVPDKLSRMYAALYQDVIWGTGTAKGVAVNDVGEVIVSGAGGASADGQVISSTGSDTPHSSQPTQPPHSTNVNVRAVRTRGQGEGKYQHDKSSFDTTSTASSTATYPTPSTEPTFTGPTTTTSRVPTTTTASTAPISTTANTVPTTTTTSTMPTTFPAIAATTTGTTVNGNGTTSKATSLSNTTDTVSADGATATAYDANASTLLMNDDAMKLSYLMECKGKVIPAVEARVPLINHNHSMGHFGRDSIFKQLFNQGYWWPNMRVDIQSVIESCDQCLRYNVRAAGFHPSQYITADGPWAHIQVDTSVHLPTTPEGHTCLLVIYVFTGFVILGH